MAHPDRESILDGRPLGGVQQDTWVDFWLDLQVLVNLLWKRYLGDDSMDICGAAGSSDAVTMIQSLRTFTGSGLPLTE
jgi:hypothetical protein